MASRPVAACRSRLPGPTASVIAIATNQVTTAAPSATAPPTASGLR